MRAGVREMCYSAVCMRALALVFLVACGGSKTAEPPPAPKDAGIPDTAVLDIPPRTLGMPDLASYMWRKRGGHPAFRIARIAEAKNQWADVVTTCKQALAADPGHLEAAWLLAAGLGHLKKYDELIAPLQLATAGDFGKWGPASLELAELQPFLKTPAGEAWSRRIESDRVAYIAALARAVVVQADGDLYAFDPEADRWYRVTRTFGAVVGSLRVAPSKIAYVTRQRGKDGKATLAMGVIDLARGKTSRPLELGTKGPVLVTYSAKQDPGVWVMAGGGVWKRLDDNFVLSTLPPKTQKPPGPWLEVKGRTARLHAIPVAGVTADWDDKGLASAIQIGKSNRVVSVPAPGLIDGNTVTWSPDRARLAFVAQLDENRVCGASPKDAPTNNAAAFVVDATTGTLTEIERGESMAVEWIGDRKLMVDQGDGTGKKAGGVTVFDLDGKSPELLAGADGLLSPRRRPVCTPAPSEDTPPPDPDANGEASADQVVEPPL